MPTTYQPINERLVAAQVALDNAQSDPILQEALANFGYDAERLEEGRALLDAAQAAQEAMAVEHGDQYEATDALQAAFDAANTTYMQHLKVARIALQDQRGAARALALTGRRKRTIPGWLDQARQFYDNALGDEAILTALGRFGITPEALAAAQAEVGAVGTANSAQEREKGEAQDATEARDQAMDALDRWMSDFRAIARVALEERPQQLEKLGILAPS
jgi:hypothetical protein